jgi:hypothetical protein
MFADDLTLSLVFIASRIFIININLLFNIDKTKIMLLFFWDNCLNMSIATILVEILKLLKDLIMNVFILPANYLCNKWQSIIMSINQLLHEHFLKNGCFH